MLNIAIIAVLISLVLLLIRALSGPTFFDRILTVNSLGTHVIVLVVLIGQLKQSEFMADIALLYALIGFVAMVGILCYFKYKPDSEE